MTMWWAVGLVLALGIASAASAADTAADNPAPEPRLGIFFTADDIAKARERAETVPWAKAQKERILRIADAWAARDDRWIRDILPPPGSKFAYGVAGCPKCGKSWKSFGLNAVSLDRPFILTCPNCQAVFDLKDPNAPFADSGDGVKVNGQVFWLRGMWNGYVTNQMWSAFSPEDSALLNLADAYALTGDPKYARKAIVIMDALATLSPQTTGPRDFNDDPNVDMGRLHHLTSIFFRAQVHLTRALDIVGRRPELDMPSPTNPGKTVWENIRYGLYDEYLFVPIDTRGGRMHTLHNHEADSFRALIIAGLTLGNPDYLRWGAEGFQAFLDNVIDRDGLYYETSLSYAGFTRSVFIDMAELLARYDPAKYPASAKMPRREDLPFDSNFFNNPRLARLTLDTPDRVSLLGREPTFGNNHWDISAWKKPGRPFVRQTFEQAQRFAIYATDEGIRRHAAQVVAAQTPDATPPNGSGATAWWSLYLSPSGDEIDRLAGKGAMAPAWDNSDVFGHTGLVYLRSGKDEARRGAVMRIGPNMPHAHNDEAGLLLFDRGRALSGDIGYGIFGNHVHLGWAAQAIAHNLVVVNQDASHRNKQFRYVPGGTVERFYDGPGVSWSEASLAGVFPPSDGVKEYRRTLLQVDLSPEDSYWVDLFDVDGGTVHDYSMHARPLGDGEFTMEQVEPKPVPDVWTLAGLDPEFRDASFDAPGRAWGERLTVGGIVKKLPGVVDEVPEKPWWYAPPGNGYGFLYDVQAAMTVEPWRATWRWDEKGDRYGLRMTVLPEETQQVITAWGPILSGQDRMRWVVVRNGSPENKIPVRTRYAAVLEAFGEQPKIDSVSAIRQDGRVVGLNVTSENRTDVILDARKAPVAAPGAPKLDAGLGLIRRDNGDVAGLFLSGGPVLEADGFAIRLHAPRHQGRVTAVDDAKGAFKVVPALPAASANSALVVKNPAYGRGSTYRVKSAAPDGKVTPLLSDTTLARGKVEKPVADGFTSATPLVFANVHEQDLRVLDGKRVVAGGKTGQVVTVNGFTGVKAKGISPKPGDAFVIYDVQVGDTVAMDGTASLVAEADGTWTLRANGPCRVAFPFAVESQANGAWRAEAGRAIEISDARAAAGPVRFRKAR